MLAVAVFILIDRHTVFTVGDVGDAPLQDGLAGLEDCLVRGRLEPLLLGVVDRHPHLPLGGRGLLDANHQRAGIGRRRDGAPAHPQQDHTHDTSCPDLLIAHGWCLRVRISPPYAEGLRLPVPPRTWPGNGGTSRSGTAPLDRTAACAAGTPETAGRR